MRSANASRREIAGASFQASQLRCIRFFRPHPSCEAQGRRAGFRNNKRPGPPRAMDASTTFARQQMLIMRAKISLYANPMDNRRDRLGVRVGLSAIQASKGRLPKEAAQGPYRNAILRAQVSVSARSCRDPRPAVGPHPYTGKSNDELCNYNGISASQ